ncbi:VanW family protein [Chryseobacterium oryctis]|uniref:VanW family protein n=1 Tax=Chryseobacterium oryctis TaxID=2952618 RepID=A0ABT3HKB8_9FLAO|nr:VanW family protein [Chryseobacterium oryctis]MCW3160148.1 VanW family protein [Chryseobacterium oryctis]
MIKKFKEVLPYQWKLQVKLLQRYLHELKNNHQYPKNYQSENIGEFSLKISQPIRNGAFFENKIHNLEVVNQKINNLIIQPQEVFSFWKLIDKPNTKNNFKEGRNLKKNTISSDVGGGICQFSSIIYYLCLQAGVKIIERHPHSIDIYKETERFTPLGSDCTVVYGYKDLQIQNTFPFPIQFKSFVNNNELHFSIISNELIDSKNIYFKYTEVQNGVWVDTYIDEIFLNKNFYIRL